MATSVCFNDYGPDVEVRELTDLPLQDIGSPEPVLFSNDSRTVLGYRTSNDRFALLAFSAWAISKGGPNDEALDGHPLFERGLMFYRSYEITNSPWVTALEQANRVHGAHKPALYAGLRHIIMTFHEAVIEFITRGYQSEILDCSPEQAEIRMLQWLHARVTPDPFSDE